MNLAFLRKVLPDEGGDLSYCAMSMSKGTGVVTEWHADIGAVLRRGLEMSGHGRNAYFALAKFRNPSEGRTQANAACLRTIILDLDYSKPGKPRDFATLEDAVAGLARFRDGLGLPEPAVVSSGYGLHVYWPFTRALPRDEWQVLANGLKKATHALGLRADDSRTADAASILRIPGTTNRDPKFPTMPVVIIKDGNRTDPSELGRLLEPYAGGSGTVQPSRVPAQPPEPPGFMSYYCDGPRDRDPRTVLGECAQIRAAGRPEASRRSWMLMLAVMRFCKFGREVAHQISAYDPARYDPAELDRQFDSTGTFGPVKCSTFMEENPGPCRDCRWAGSVATPVSVRALAPPAAPPSGPAAPPPFSPVPSAGPSTPALPDGLVPFEDDEFVVVPGHGLYNLIPSKDPNNPAPVRLHINEYEFYIREIHADTGNHKEKRVILLTVRTRGMPFRDVELDLYADLHGTGLSAWLDNHGLSPRKTRYNKTMREFMGSYLASIQSRKKVRERKSHFGWDTRLDRVTGTHEEGFVVGNRMYFGRPEPEIVTLDARCAPLAEREYTRAGDLETFRKVLDLYGTLNQKDAQLFVCASFATPFLRLGPGTARNLIMSMWDEEGGKGKTTLLYAVNAVWGHPTELVSGKNDTLSARFQLLGARHSLPFVLDETTNMPEHEMSAFLFDVANGREKRKSQKFGEGLQSTGQWTTITFLSSNRSIYELMQEVSSQRKSESMRVLEIRCGFRNYAGTPTGQLIEERIGLLHDNHGLAGPAFINDCLARPGTCEGIALAAREFDGRVRTSAPERFWSYGLGTILAAGRKAKELGYLGYDMDMLEKWAVEQLLPHLRWQVTDSVQPSMSFLSMFFNSNVDKTLVVASDRPVQAPDEDGLEHAAYVWRFPQRELRIRYEARLGRVYVESEFFNSWCVKKTISSVALLDYLMAEGVWDGMPELKVLGEHVGQLAQLAVQCLRFELDGSLVDMMNHAQHDVQN
jgi:hypothetical protein